MIGLSKVADSGAARGSCDKSRGHIECRANLSPADIISFVVARCPHQNSGVAKLTITALRSFLGFLHLDGITERSLVCVVPSVARRRLAGLPKGLEPDQVKRLLASCDANSAVGCRELAILALLARLGLQRGEVAKLMLDDIDWRAGTIIVRGKRSRIERLPGRRASAGTHLPAGCRKPFHT